MNLMLEIRRIRDSEWRSLFTWEWRRNGALRTNLINLVHPRIKLIVALDRDIVRLVFGDDFKAIGLEICSVHRFDFLQEDHREGLVRILQISLICAASLGIPRCDGTTGSVLSTAATFSTKWTTGSPPPSPSNIHAWLRKMTCFWCDII